MISGQLIMNKGQTIIRTTILAFTILSLSLNLSNPPVFAKETDIAKELDKRLKEIMDEKTHDFFALMLIKDSYLNFMVQSLNREMKLRKSEGNSFSESEINLIYGADESLIRKYQEELAKILQMYDDLNSLEKTSRQTDNYSAIAKIDQLRTRLKTVLNVTDFRKTKAFSREMTQNLLRDYNAELDKLMKIVRELQKLKVKARQPSLKSAASKLENDISNTLQMGEKSRDPIVDSYISEVIQIVDILRQLDELDQKHAGDDIEIHRRIREIKNNVLAVVDKKALTSLGYGGVHNGSEKKSLDYYFDEWKARQILVYRAKLKQAELLKERLISKGTEAQNSRLFEADVLQAVHEFNNGNFALAQYFFEDILKFYPYKKMADFQYYLAECYLTQKKYAQAQDLYLNITENSRELEYVKRAYWRLMLISDSYNRYRDFFTYADKAINLYRSAREDQFLGKVILYSGYMGYRLGRFKQSLALLEKISAKSPYYMQSQFITAVNYLNLNRPEKAQPILTFLGKEKSYQKYDDIAKAIRNQALLKTGLLYYNDNDLAEAMKTLKKVKPETPGFDVTLLAEAWTWFRLGDLQQAANELDLLFWNHLGSNYIYEAMMLSAHCNRLLGNVKSSIRKVRYVENAEKTLQINNEMNRERQRINTLLTEINKMEEQVVMNEDTYVFQKIETLRRNLELSLQSMAYRGDPGFQMIQELEEEQQRLEKLIKDYHDMNKIADILGRKDLKKEIRKTVPKLEAKLLEVQKLQNVKRVDIMADYPLARKESNLLFQREKLSKMRDEVKNEQKKLEFYREEIATLLEKADREKNPDAVSRLDYHKLEIKDLKNRLEVFMVFLAESNPKMPDTNFHNWSDFSGFGMSDLDFVRMKNMDRKIKQNNERTSLINSAFRYKEREIMRRLAVMDGRISNLEKSVYRKNIDDVKTKREKYFAEDYFVNRTSETKIDADQELKILLEEQERSTAKDVKIEKNKEEK